MARSPTRPRARVRAAFAIAGLTVAVAGWFDLYQHYAVPAPLAVVSGVARGLPVLLCPYRPLAAWWAALGAAVVTAAATDPVSAAEPWPWAVTSVLSLVIVLTVLTLRAPRRVAVAMWAALLVAGAILTLTREPIRPGELVPMTVLSALVPLTAEAVRGRGDAQRRLAVVEELGEAERARRALLEERARIARELHDVVAHHMSVIIVRADSAQYRVPELPAAAHAEFDAIAGEARRSLTEMRRLLHVLRQDADAAPRHSPQPGLAEVPTLIEGAHRAGLDARMSLADTVPAVADVPLGVQLSVYRVVQESLSNAVRHAPGTQVRVAVSGDTGTLLVEVTNSAPGRAPSVEPDRVGGGQGLIGMRERVAMLGGELDAGPTPDGGFRVRATLPVTPAAGPAGEHPGNP